MAASDSASFLINGVRLRIFAGLVVVAVLGIAALAVMPGMGYRISRLTVFIDPAHARRDGPAYQYFQPYMTGFYLPKEEPALEKAISEQIDAMYKDGRLGDLIKKYGGDPDQFLKPSADMAKQRQTVDRPTSWQPPSL